MARMLILGLALASALLSGCAWQETLRDTLYDATIHSRWRPDDYGQPIDTP
jgi:hypothetical protein